LEKINKCIERAENLTSEGVIAFNKNTKVILEMAGPEVARKVMDMGPYEDEINKALEDKQYFLYRLNKSQGC
jgi:hypothetical protein